MQKVKPNLRHCKPSFLFYRGSFSSLLGLRFSFYSGLYVRSSGQYEAGFSFYRSGRRLLAWYVGFLFYREDHPPLVLGRFSPYRIEPPGLVRIPTGILGEHGSLILQHPLFLESLVRMCWKHVILDRSYFSREQKSEFASKFPHDIEKSD